MARSFTYIALGAMFLFLVNSGTSYAAQPFAPARAQQSEPALLMQLRQASGGPISIARHAETGKIRFLSVAPGTSIPREAGLAASASSEQIARGFLASYGSLFGLRAQTDQLSDTRETQAGGRAFVHFQQRYNNVPVLGGELVVQLDGKRTITSANGEIVPDLAIATTPTIGQDVAQQRAVLAVAQAYKLPADAWSASQPQLWIYNPVLLGGSEPRVTQLTWRVEVRNTTAQTAVRELVLVNAQNGLIALHFNQIAEAKERHICDNNNVRDADNDETNNCPASRFVRNEGDPESAVSDVNRAYEYAGATYDYYNTHFGRDSIDGAGMPIISLVRYCFAAASCPYANAFWDGQQMTYGAGYASGDDVVGHELTHGVTEHSSGLFYYYQSGAINEAMSDIFGELIDLSYHGAHDNDAANVRWDIGEDLPHSSKVLTGTIRSLKDPNGYGQPDRITDPLYYADPYFQDNGGVHWNSGIASKAAYLIADGGTFNGFTVRGLGLEKMGQIFYRVNTAFLTSGSDYGDLFDLLPAACQSLIGVAGIVQVDCAQVASAAMATEMNQQPVEGGAPAKASTCGSGLVAVDSFYDDLEHPETGNWAAQSLPGTANTWYYPQRSAPADALRLLGGSSYATSGVNNFWGYAQGAGEPGDSVIAMTRDVLVPTQGYLAFRHAYGFEATQDYQTGALTNYDGGVVEYSADSGTTWADAGALFDHNGYANAITTTSDNPLGGRSAFVGLSNGYTSSRVDLSSLAGKNIRFRFRLGTDSYNPIDSYAPQRLPGWFIDDVRVYACVPAITWSDAALTLGTNSATLPQETSSFTLPLNLSVAVSNTASVDYTVRGSDQTGHSTTLISSGTLVFAPNTAKQTLVVALSEDQRRAFRSITVALANPRYGALTEVVALTITVPAPAPIPPPATPTRTYLPLLGN